MNRAAWVHSKRVVVATLREDRSQSGRFAEGALRFWIDYAVQGSGTERKVPWKRLRIKPLIDLLRPRLVGVLLCDCAVLCHGGSVRKVSQYNPDF